MKKNYLLISAFVTALTLSAQVKQPTFENIENMLGESGHIPFLYEAGAAWGDYNNDNYLDLFVSGIGADGCFAGLYKNVNGTSFENVMAETFPGLRNANITWFDYDNDGNLDLFLAGKKNDETLYSGLWKNKGGENGFEEVLIGTFPQIANRGGNRSTRYVVATDYDNDGWTDLYIQGTTNTGGDIHTDAIGQLWHNEKGETFTLVEKPIKEMTSEPQPFISLAGGNGQWADFDGDGDMDLVVSGEALDADKYDADYGYHGSYNGQVYKNNGNGTFSKPIEFFIGVEEGDAVWLDYDNNGKMELAVSGVSWSGDWTWRGDLHFFDNTGVSQSYGAEQTGLPSTKQGLSMTAGDVNNDGLTDLLYMNGVNGDEIYLNNGNIEQSPMFTAMVLNYGEQGAQRGGTATLADYNNDGSLDAFCIGYADAASSYPRLMKNNLGEGMPANTAPNAPTNLKATYNANVGIAMFSWEASTDDLTPSEALKYNIYVKQGDKVYMTLPADLETGHLKVGEVSAAIGKTGIRISGLTGESLEWGVQAIDNGKMASTFATSTYMPSNIEKNTLDASVLTYTTQGQLHVTSTTPLRGTLNVYTITGNHIHSELFQSELTIELPAGIYLVQINTSEGNIMQKVIVK